MADPRTGSHGLWGETQQVFSPCAVAFRLLSHPKVTLSSGISVYSQPILGGGEEEQEGRWTAECRLALEHPDAHQEHRPPLFREKQFGAHTGLCIAVEFPEVIGFGYSVTSTNKGKHNYSHLPVGYRGN